VRLIARPLVLLAAFALLAAACGSGEGEEAAPATPDPTEEATPEATEVPDEPQGSLAAAGDEEPEEDSGPVAGGVMRVGLAEVTSPDPAKASPGSQSQLVLADLLYDGLTEWDSATGELRPALATSWELSDDLLTWEFELAEGASFSDGEPVTGADIKMSLQRVVSGDPLAPAATRLEVIKGFQKFVDGSNEGISGIDAGENSVSFTLSSPFSQLPQLLASPIYGVVAGSAEGFDAVVTSGSFDVADADDGVLALEAREGSGVLLDGIDVHLYEDRSSAAEALQLGDLDWAVIDRHAAANLDGDLDAFQAQLTYEMTVTKGVLADASLRRAIMMAVDSAAIAADIYPGTATAVDGLVPGSGACGEGNDVCGYSPDAAAEIIEDGFPDGDVPTVHVDYYDNGEGREKAVATAIAADLEAIGIPAKARAHDFLEFADLLASGDLELFRSGWVGVYPSPEAWLGRYHSESLDNLGFLISPDTDEALDAARSADTHAEAAEGYADAEAAILGSAPVLPLLQLNALSAAATTVQDLNQRLDGTFDIEAVWLLP
jgi:oligopeptide transport system substrate-binding protein